MPEKTARAPRKRAPKDTPLEVVYRALDAIRPDPKNARKHPAGQIEELRVSIRKFGFTNPILLRPNGMIGAGGGRYEAAKLELLKEVPTITLHLTEKQWRAYALADNKIPLGAQWDTDILRAELDGLKMMDVDTGGLGFESFEADLAPLSDAPTIRSKVNKTVIQYNIVFDDVEQQERWFAFVKELKTTYAAEPTLGSRLIRFLEGRGK